MPVLSPHMTLQEVADELRISVRTVRRAIDRGDLPAVRLGPRTVRIRADALESLANPKETPS